MNSIQHYSLFTNEKDKLRIELWKGKRHNGQKVSDGTDEFLKEKGWKTLIIWEDELKDIKLVEHKICKFVGKT